MRTIDADYVLGKIGEYAMHPNEELVNNLAIAFDIVVDAPTIDAVEVVRCKDCKYFEFDSWAKVNEIPIIVAHEICKFWGSGCGCKTDSDGYCSFGERKEDE